MGTRDVPSKEGAGRETAAAFIAEWSALGQSVATQRWIA